MHPCLQAGSQISAQQLLQPLIQQQQQQQQATLQQ
jgi:hypothetical protein